MLVSVAITLTAGIVAQIAAYRLRLPAIVPLLILGAALGQTGILRPQELGSGLQAIVQLGVAIILFEGGLSLKASRFREASRIIRNLVTLGVLVTWVGAAAATYWIIPELRNTTGLYIAILFGALVTVSGPTVIMPLLKVVKPQRKLATILKWEAILVDPIGALLAVVTLTFIETSASQGFLLREFLRSISIGLAFGGLGALFLNWVLRVRELYSEDLRNFLVLGFVVVLFAFSDWLQPETGILSVTVAGFILGLLDPPGLREIETFKGQLTLLMVSILFILLAADLDLQAMMGLGARGLLLLAVIMLVVRPVNVFLCARGTGLNWREKLFLSWIAPRGIVAAAVASLFSEALQHSEVFAAQAGYVESLTFLVIGGTVFFQGGTARYVGRWLKVLEPEPNGLIVVGANAPARHLATEIGKRGIQVMLLDTNPQYVAHARREGLNAIVANAISPETLEELDLSGFGKLLAMTPNEKVNILACQLWSREFGKNQVYRVRLEGEADAPPEKMGLSGEGHLVFPSHITLEWLQHRLGDRWTFERRTVSDAKDREALLEQTRRGEVVPLAFLEDGKLRFYEEGVPVPAQADWLVLVEQKKSASPARGKAKAKGDSTDKKS